MSVKQKVIAINGPSASGEGTVVLRVIQALGFDYLDSDALYRPTALYTEKRGVGQHDEEVIARLAENLPARFEEARIMLNDEDVSVQICDKAIGTGVPAITQLPKVRVALLQRQRDFLTEKGLVAGGRDMGPVVFHDAVLKVSLTASAQIRAQQRAQQPSLPYEGVEFNRILSGIETKDEADRRRPIAPLRQLPDAILLDTTGSGIKKPVKKVLD